MSILSTLALGGSIGTIGAGTMWVFAGPTVTATTTSATQRFTGVAQAPIGLSAGGPQDVDYDLCYQPSSGGIVSNFAGGHYSTGQVTTSRSIWTAAGSVVPGAPGTWLVGFCLRNNHGALDVDANDWVNGWIMVTN